MIWLNTINFITLSNTKQAKKNDMPLSNLRLIDKLNHIKHLFLLGKKDESLDEKEISIITQIAKHHGLNYKDINYIVNHTDEIPFSLPETFTDRLAALYDMVLLMVSDFNIHEDEIAFCKEIAKKYEFNPQVINELIEDVLGFIIQGKECDDVMQYLVKYAHPKANLN